jgi:hypothetical protein
MSHLTNNSPKVIKTGTTWQRSKWIQRPKRLTDEEWTAMLKDSKLNKLIVLNKVPKVSRAAGNRKPNRD